MIQLRNSIKKFCSETNIGGKEVRIRLQLYETCLVPSSY